MGYKNREIELKLQLVSGQTYNQLKKVLGTYTESEHSFTVVGKAADYYWTIKSNADFLRLRRQNNGIGGILTFKGTDKATNFNRIEYDLDVSDFKQALDMHTYAFGAPREVFKKYHVFFTGENEHDNFSVYQVSSDPEKRIFLEIEAVTAMKVHEMLGGLSLAHPEFKFDVVPYSIYQMFGRVG